MSENVFICALVKVLHHILLKEQRVVAAHGAGLVKELLEIMTNVRLPFGRKKLVNINFVTQVHHDNNACRRKEEKYRGASEWQKEFRKPSRHFSFLMLYFYLIVNSHLYL